MHIFRSHQRAVLVFMFVAIGVPMLFFGVPWDGLSPHPNGEYELARVAGVPVMASEFVQNLNLAARRSTRPGGQPPTFQELEQQGVAREVLKEMLASALIRREENQRDFQVNQSLLEERLRDDPTFKDDAGTFIPARYNAWVTSREGMDWEPVFQDIQERISRQVFMNTVLASANRVLDKDVQQELIDNATKIQMEYLKVEPKVEPGEEEIAAFHKENEENYRKPSTYAADYVSISLRPEPSENVKEVLEKARKGEDFAALSDQYSDLETKNGGDFGWQSEHETELEYSKPMFALAPGEVSDPAPGPGGFYIYKVDEERTNEETGKREVKVRRIYVKVALSDDDKIDRELKAKALSDKAKEVPEGSEKPLGLKAAAAALDLAVQHAEGFTVESTEIAGIPRTDAFQFRRVLDEEAEKPATEYPVITGGENLYVAEVASTTKGEIPPLDEVREIVTQDVIAKDKNSDAYREQVTALAERIKAEAKTLGEVKEKFPELDAQIKETRPFSKSEYLFQDQIYLQTPEVYTTLADKAVGELAGPLTDFLGATYFIALTKREEPTEEDKAKWDEEGKAIREQRVRRNESEQLQDYLAYLRERELPRVDWSVDEKVYDRVVGNTKDETAAEDTMPLAPPAEMPVPTELPVPAESPSGP